MKTANDLSYALFGEHGAPNLDGLSIDPIDLSVAADVFDKLGSYATGKAQAMRLRLDGHIEDALKVERSLERLYQSLPLWARW